MHWSEMELRISNVIKKRNTDECKSRYDYLRQVWLNNGKDFPKRLMELHHRELCIREHETAYDMLSCLCAAAVKEEQTSEQFFKPDG